MDQAISQVGSALGVVRDPIKLPSGEFTTEYQEWKLVFGHSERKGRRRRKKEIVTMPPITREELVKDRFGVVLHQRLSEVAPNRLFDADYYVLQYHLPDAPFLINVRIDDASAVLRAYDAFERVPAKAFNKLAEFDRFKLVPRKVGDPPFNMAPKNLVDGQLNGTATMVNWLAAQYVNNRLDIKSFDKIMGMRPIDMKREVYAYIPRDEQPTHEYLLAAKKVKRIAPEVQYKSGMITLQEFADMKNPERKAERDKDKITYPLPERTYVCCICHVDRAQIKCMECPNRVCKECMQTTFLDYPEEQTFLLLHHMYCLRFGRPSRAFFGTKLRTSARAMAMIKGGRKAKSKFSVEDEDRSASALHAAHAKRNHKHKHGHGLGHKHHRHQTEVVQATPKLHDGDHRVLIAKSKSKKSLEKQKSAKSIASSSSNASGSGESKEEGGGGDGGSGSSVGFPSLMNSSGSGLFSIASGKSKAELLESAEGNDLFLDSDGDGDGGSSAVTLKKQPSKGIFSMMSSKSTKKMLRLPSRKETSTAKMMMSSPI
mmetsp:Transcript_60727/g.166770  ORF Transcript_60727/g.166770 Transcript_60727/m.166770 type:complete len:542 (-) Transcript_60727:240-1865(-)